MEMRKREPLSDDLRKKLLDNDNIANVSKCNIYLTPDFKEIAYKKLNDGAKILKIFNDANLPVGEPLLSRSRHMKTSIMRQGKTGNFGRNEKTENFEMTSEEKKSGVDPEKYEFLRQQYEFLKKISEMEKN